MKKRRYPWEIGTHLAAEVQARDLKSAQHSILLLADVIYGESAKRSFDEVKLRILQILTIANRAAYDAGANPDRLFHVNIRLVNRTIRVSTQKQLVSLARRAIRDFVSLVPDKDFLSAKKLNDAMGYIREHCTQPISRAAVADVIGCSPSHLSTMFSRITGHTFKQIVLTCRMEKAKELLRQSEKTVTEVAFAVGYQDPNYFTAAFKRVTGVTPRQYRTRIPEAPRPRPS